VPPYSIDLHHHRFAAWAAATAASSSPLCRFTVRHGAGILKAAGFGPELSHPDRLPEPAHLDAQHRTWRERVRTAAKRRGLSFSHGVAAKLINCYLKARFTCSGFHRHPRVQALHPPIDAVLLQHLGTADVGGQGRFWRKMHRQRWSTFTSAEYQSVIKQIRTCLPNQPLWAIESHWPGFQ
jgi:hypothetical protein